MVVDDVNDIMKDYRFVTRKNRKTVMGALEHTIKAFDMVCILATYPMMGLVDDEVITDILRTLKTLDELLQINKEAVQMSSAVFERMQVAGGLEGALPFIESVFVRFVEKWDGKTGYGAFQKMCERRS